MPQGHKPMKKRELDDIDRFAIEMAGYAKAELAEAQLALEGARATLEAAEARVKKAEASFRTAEQYFDKNRDGPTN